MLTLHNPEPAFYNRIHALSGACLLLAQLFLFIAALPPFQYGIWLQTEPLMLLIFSAAALTSLWLLVGVMQGWLVWRGAPALGWCLLAWVAWQLLASCAAPLPWRSWFGSPETGEGAGWYASFLLMVLLASALWKLERYRTLILAAAAASLLLQAGLHALIPLDGKNHYIPGSWRPATWSAYLAFMAGYLWIACAHGGWMKNRRNALLAALFSVLILLLSHNVSAINLLGFALLCPFLPFMRPAKPWRALWMAACLIPLGWALFSASFSLLEPYTARIAPLQMLSDKDGSLGSRIALNQMGLAALRHEPFRWLVGGGWGGFPDVAFRYALTDGVTVYQEGKRAPNSLAIDGYSFHSHNQPLDALLALGLVGMCLWFALPMLAGLAALSGLWFELAQCLPYKALALAALCQHGRIYGNIKKPFLIAALSLLAVLMAWSALEQKKTMAWEMQLRDAAHALPYGDYPLAWVERDIPHGGDRLRSCALFFAAWLDYKRTLAEPDANDAGWYRRFMEAAHDATLKPATGPYAASLELLLAQQLMLDAPASFATLKAQARDSLPDAVIALARKAPYRDDLATPMLLNLAEFTHGDPDKSMNILRRLLTVAPDHRGALWGMGGLLMQQPGHESEGAALREKALALGLSRIYPIENQ